MADVADAALNLDQGDAAFGGAGAGAGAGAGGAGAARAAAAAARGPSSILSGKRLLVYGAISTTAAAVVTFNAFRQRSNYYAAAVWLGRSNGSMLILLNFGIFAALMYALAVQFIFFGQLRPMEVEHLHERAWYALTESLLAMTIFRDEFDVKFVIMFGTLLFLKVFHWLTEDRVDYMEQTPSVSYLFHARMLGMLGTMTVVDAALVAWSLEAVYLDTKQLGLTIMFSTEFQILLAVNLSIGAKYIINCIDSYSDDVWEKKSMYVFYVDLATDFVKLLIYSWFFAFILATYGFPFNLVRDVVFTARSFFGRVRDLLRYREATRNMNERYPNATLSDLRGLSDATCIICRDEMVVAGGEGVPPGQPSAQETPKRLPCGHIFHFHCLRSWLERQQSCPTCRRTVLQNGEAGAGTGAAQRPQAAAAAAAAAAAPARPQPPAPGARPAPPAAPAATAAGAAPVTATPTPTVPTAAARSAVPDSSSATAGPSQPSTSATAAGANGTAAGESAGAAAAATADADEWTLQGAMERLRKGLELARADANRRRAEWAQRSGRPEGTAAAGGSGAGNGNGSGSGLRPPGVSTPAAAAAASATAGPLLAPSILPAFLNPGPSSREDANSKLDRVPLALLELLFETSLAQEKIVRDLGQQGREARDATASGAAPTLVLPLSHATGPLARTAWLPPRPDQLPELRSTTSLDSPRAGRASSTTTTAAGSSSSATTAVRTEFVRSGAPSPSTVSAVSESRANGTTAAAEQDGAEDGAGASADVADPDDPRRAVREAALRRFGSSAPSAIPAASTPTAPAEDASAEASTPTPTDAPIPSVDKGKGKAVERDDVHSLAAQGSVTPTQAQLPGNPRLISISSARTPPAELPFPLDGARSAAATAAAPQAPAQAQAAVSDEALQERLRVLKRLEAVIGEATGELQRLLGSQDAGDSAGAGSTA
ncbi:E3 ubiquitin-protein ligase hrd1 [Tilletia horrida]|nr:E3 ubiquitin-protein ligase hrd1 [Tilletia horrida]